jgi:MFS family permease
MQFVMTGAMTLAPLWLAGQGWSTPTIGLAVSLHMVGMYAFAPIFGRLVTRYGGGWTLGFTLGLVGIVLLSAVVADAAAVVVLRLFLVGVAWSAAQITSTLELSRLANTPDPAAGIRTQGTIDLLASLAGGCGIALAGLLLTSMPYSVIQLAHGATMLVVALGVGFWKNRK